MVIALERLPICAERNLRWESKAPINCDDSGCFVYATAGAKNTCCEIASTLPEVLGARVRRQSCLSFNSDARVRTKLPTYASNVYLRAAFLLGEIEADLPLENVCKRNDILAKPAEEE